MMMLSVIITCYNAADTIGDTLAAFVDQRWHMPWEILVVDNRSTDESMAIVESYKKCLPNLRIVAAWERQGQPHALNVGIQEARGECVAFCDADDVVAPGWVAAMGEALLEHDFVAARMETAQLNTQSWVSRWRIGNVQRDGLQLYKYPPYLPHAGGGTIGFRRDLAMKIGGFREEFVLLHDTDFCWRMQQAGVKLTFVEDAVIHIRFRTTLRGLHRQAKGYGRYNVLLYKVYRQQGMPALPWTSGLRAWLRLAMRLVQLRRKEDFAHWLWDFSWRWGRVLACITYGVLAL